MKALWIVARGINEGWRIFYFRLLPYTLALIILLTILRFDVPVFNERGSGLDHVVSGKQFDFVAWEFSALTAKLGHELTLPQYFMSDEEQGRFVRDYIRRVGEFQKLEGRIQHMYADPSIKDPIIATADLRAERDQLRAEINARQNLAEAIIQEQIESVLREEGFAVGGQAMPPLRFRFTELPDVLIISRRDRIERIDARGLTTGLTVDEQDRIEREVDRRFDVSSLVTPIGGLAAYPTMLPESSSLQWVVDVAAHEWTHNYLMFVLSYVGWNLTSDRVALTINETTANIVGREVGKRVIERFYPELSAAISSDISASPATSESKEEKKFDFRKEMRETRVRTDELLAEGKIEQAEQYMEERRALLVKNGYYIRKLNQAYFAFYGAYNDVPGGAPTAGKDPVGPAVQELRKRSKTLGDFVRAITTVRNLDDLNRLMRE